jgi:hypothetical protein
VTPAPKNARRGLLRTGTRRRLEAATGQPYRRLPARDVPALTQIYNGYASVLASLYERGLSEKLFP